MNEQRKKMALKVVRIAVALCLGLILAAYPVVAMSASDPPLAKSCCGHCPPGCKMGCCPASQVPATPVAPAPVHSSAQNDLQALSASIISLLTLPAPVSNEFTPRISSPASVKAVPLFQRDCCYLI